jgi:hypothetical protein
MEMTGLVRVWNGNGSGLEWFVSALLIRVVLSDVLGGKDIVEGRDGRTDGRVG